MRFAKPFHGDRVTGLSGSLIGGLIDVVEHHSPNGKRRALVKELQRLFHVGTQSQRVLVENASDVDVDLHNVLGIDDILIDVDNNESEFFSDLDFRCVLPTDAHHDRFVITDEPIRRNGGTGLATMFGASKIKVDVKSRGHQFATIIPGVVDRLATAPTGCARLDFVQRDRTQAELDAINEARVEAGDDPLAEGQQPPLWAKAFLSRSAGRRLPGEIIVGELLEPLADPRSFTGGGTRDGTTAMMLVHDIDPDGGLLTDRDEFRHDIVAVNPGDPAADPPGDPWFEIDANVGGLISEWHPLHVVESTGWNREWTVDAGFGVQPGGRFRIPVKEAIPEVFDDQDPPQPVVDGVLCVPGTHRLKFTERRELVTNRRGIAAAEGAFVVAVWTGYEYLVLSVDC